MKKILKISLLLLILLVVKKEVVYAKDYNDSFYPGNYIDNEFIKKSNGEMAYYKEHRFINRTSDNQFAYCLEPFVDLKENQIYEAYTDDYAKKLSLSKEAWNKVRLISYYGYGYGNHTDKIWYAVTQLLIWQTSDLQGDYYFTDTLKGNRINSYQKEIDELNHLVDLYSTLPSFSEKTYHLIEKGTIILEDTNNVLSHYNIHTNYTSINNNKLTITGLKEGQYLFTLTRKEEIQKVM